MKTLLGLTFTCLLLLTNVAPAEVLTHNGAKVQITVPKGWHQKQDGDVLLISSPSDEMNVVFVVLEQNDVDKALAQMDRTVEKAVGEVTWDHDGNAVVEEINGMPTYEWNGSAKKGSIYVDVLSIDTPSDKNLGVYWFTAAAAAKRYEADLKTIVKGLKPAK
jgi:hypothetical protein